MVNLKRLKKLKISLILKKIQKKHFFAKKSE